MNRDTIIETRPTHRADPGEPAIEIGRTRLIVIGALFTIVFMVIGYRLIDLSVLNQRNGAALANAARGHNALPPRAGITDRNGVLLATSLASASLYADAALIMDPKQAAARLVKVLPELSKTKLRRDFESRRRHIWIKRHLTPRQQYQVNRLGIPGLEFKRESRRIYPTANAASHAIGFTDVDGVGLAGLERYFDRQLGGGTTPLASSLDIRVQQILHQELARAMARFSAIGAAGIVMDVDTGEIIAMVSLPDFNPNHMDPAATKTQFNRNTSGVYEMGSTFKIFTTAMALDSGAATLASGFDAREPIKVSRHVIRDFHAKRRWLSVPEIFMYSSNIGAVKMALAVGQERQQRYLHKLGLLTRPSIELAETGKPLLPHRWREIHTMTISFGHGLSVTPLHMASAVASVVNGGVYRSPTMIKQEGPTDPGKRIFSAGTSDKMRRLMRLVVENGTGRKASAPGYLVGGKTGTAEKVAGRRYRKRALLSSFVAAFPMTAPRYVVLAVVDEPKGRKDTFGYATGGWVAAPVVGDVIKRIGPLLGVTPVKEDSPEIQERMYVNVGKRVGRRQLASY